MGRTRDFRNKHSHLLQHESLEMRCVLSAIGFTTTEVFASDINAPSSVYAADLDEDGDLDVLSTSRSGIHWQENTDGQGGFGSPREITQESGAQSYAIDVDGDGDLDVLSASVPLTWFENTNGRGAFDVQHVITEEGYHVSSVYPADLDGDGDLDVVATIYTRPSVAAIGLTIWFENIDSAGTFGAEHEIARHSYPDPFPGQVLAADIDGDKDMDVVSVLSTSSGHDRAVWYENIDGMGVFSPANLIPSTDSITFIASAYAADMDDDGDVDILTANFYEGVIGWNENLDGRGAFSEQKVISGNAHGARYVYVTDLDGDGDSDVLSAAEFFHSSNGEIAWIENFGEGNFGQQQLITQDVSWPSSLFAADLDQDGDADVLSASSNDDKVAWYENADGLGEFGSQSLLTRVSPAQGLLSAITVDIDGDEDLDLLTASRGDDKIAWHENIDGDGSFGTQKLVANVHLPGRVYAGDIDGDGDMDVISTSDELTWHENIDGNGDVWEPHSITFLPGPIDASIDILDVDGDGDSDVVTASYICSPECVEGVLWFENGDGKGTFAAQHVVVSATNKQFQSRAADVDSDGDVDLFVMSSGWNSELQRTEAKVSWYENLGGKEGFRERLIAAPVGDRVYVADMDGDGDVDVLTTALLWNDETEQSDHQLLWNENKDSKGTFGEQQLITTQIDATIPLQFGDMDGDGGTDVIAVTIADRRLTLYGGREAPGEFVAQAFIAEYGHESDAIHLGDVDMDGNLDVISVSRENDGMYWHHNRLIGDVDDDGEVGFADFLALSQNFGKAADAVWEDGDFNADDEVDFTDFLLLSQNFGSIRA